MYYGALDTLEAQYPGLDYTYLPHRRRLSRYAWHRRLFRVFDDLGLTKDEILNLCQWEGTRAAKERYEREAQTQVRITTVDEIFTPSRGPGPRAIYTRRSNIDAEEREEPAGEVLREDLKPDQPPETDTGDEGAADTDLVTLLRTFAEGHQESIREGVSPELTNAWEQWLKDVLEENETDVETIMNAVRWLDRETRADGDAGAGQSQASTNSSSAPSVLTPPDRSYDALHLMVDQLQTNNDRLAADNAALELFLRHSQAEAAS
jgi:hypothetical protein